MIVERRAPREMRRMRVPSGSYCSLCSRTARVLIVVTDGRLGAWFGFCVPCAEQLALAAEEPVETNWVKRGGAR